MQIENDMQSVTETKSFGTTFLTMIEKCIQIPIIMSYVIVCNTSQRYPSQFPNNTQRLVPDISCVTYGSLMTDRLCFGSVILFMMPKLLIDTDEQVLGFVIGYLWDAETGFSMSNVAIKQDGRENLVFDNNNSWSAEAMSERLWSTSLNFIHCLLQ